MEDRKRLLALPLPAPEIPQPGSGSGGSSGGTGGSGAVPQILKPILVDKQLSEPSSPTSKTFSEQPKPRQIHRGHSDLSSRVQKKRVTLRWAKEIFHFSNTKYNFYNPNFSLSAPYRPISYTPSKPQLLFLCVRREHRRLLRGATKSSLWYRRSRIPT